MHRIGGPPTVATSHRRLRRLGVVAAAAGLAYVVIGAICFIAPHSDPLPSHSDVAMVLGPVSDRRLSTAADLLDRGEVGAVQISLWPDHGPPGSPTRHAEDLCDRDRRVRCTVPDPATTAGEAEMLAAQAEQHGWRSVVVVTQNAHLLRARLIISRCFAGRITLRDSGEGPSKGWPYQFAYQTAATVKALLDPGC